MNSQQSIMQLFRPPRIEYRVDPKYFQDTENRMKLHSMIILVLNEMPVLMRRAFVLRHYRGLSLAELSARIGLTENDLVSLLRAADFRLQHVLGIMIQAGGNNAKSA